MSKFIFGIFSDEEKVMHSISHLRANGVKVRDVISPFPIHGMDHALGLETNLFGKKKKGRPTQVIQLKRDDNDRLTVAQEGTGVFYFFDFTTAFCA